MADIKGGLKTQIKVDVDMNRLQAYGLDINEIVTILARENQNISGGETYEGVYKYTLRTTGEFRTIDDIGNVVVALKSNNAPIRLRELATIYEGYDEDGDIVKVNGTPAVSISINKESGANMVAVSKAIRKRLEKLNLPEVVKYEVLFNNADTVNKSISGVLDSAWQGGLFSIIILMIYLWNIRTVSIIAVSIPMSIITTFIIMYFMGITLNIISLAGLVLGIGMMVDNSIVVLENVFFYRNNGYGKYSSAIDGTYTVALAIPFGFAGSILLLLISGQTLNVYSAIGIIVLIGVAVNNGIVLIDYMNQLMQEKKINGDESALIAGPRRLRPVLMTSLTTILGLLPMALAGGEGNEMYKPLSIALLGGLAVSAMFTLVIVPTVYADIRNRIPLKDYDAKDISSVENGGNIDNALGETGK